MTSLVDSTTHPALARLVRAQLDAWPEHERFLAMRFAERPNPFVETVATLIETLSDSQRGLAEDYRWLCDRLYEEELVFRRTGSYRLSRFEDAVREVYDNRKFMERYMNALLISQLWWANHTKVMDFFANRFLSGNRDEYSHLEIGPGHGLLLYFAAHDPRCGAATAWDLSDASLAATGAALARWGVRREVALVKRNLFDPIGVPRLFDSIVLSEVCEHLEDPKSALEHVRDHLAPEGRLFVNVPVNSPAPDHIYLLRSPEEAVELVKAAGYRVVETSFFPMTGHTEVRARRMRATISCVVVGAHP
jgi:2-polyprenyl-3-methyl-5-hydroxy-6-metoxy-1,4-benzoquinol methylase